MSNVMYLDFETPGFKDVPIPPTYDALSFDQSADGRCTCVGFWDKQGRLISFDWKKSPDEAAVGHPINGEWPAVRVTAVVERRPCRQSATSARLLIIGRTAPTTMLQRAISYLKQRFCPVRSQLCLIAMAAALLLLSGCNRGEVITPEMVCASPEAFENREWDELVVDQVASEANGWVEFSHYEHRTKCFRKAGH